MKNANVIVTVTDLNDVYNVMLNVYYSDYHDNFYDMISIVTLILTLNVVDMLMAYVVLSVGHLNALISLNFVSLYRHTIPTR